MSVDTTTTTTTSDEASQPAHEPAERRRTRRVPRPRQAAAGPVVVVDAVGDSAIRHSCGAMVTPLFGVGGPTSCPLCHETV